MKIINKILLNGQFSILKSFLFANNLPWFYQDEMVQGDNRWFSHCFYNDYAPKSDGFNAIIPLLEELKVKAPIEVTAKCLVKSEKQYQSKMHRDKPFDCKTAIIYMNTCNGYTIVDYDNKLHNVPCEENKALVFDSKLLHAAVSQTDTKRRIIINLNYF